MDPTFKQYTSLNDLYAVGSDVFMLGMPFYGAIGRVLSLETERDIRIRVSFQEPLLFDLSPAYAAEQVVRPFSPRRVGYLVSIATELHAWPRSSRSRGHVVTASVSHHGSHVCGQDAEVRGEELQLGARECRSESQVQQNQQRGWL